MSHNPNRNIQALYPATPMQQGMLFHSAYAAQSGVYVEQFQLTLAADINPQAFQQAWQQLAAQHDVLRTCFIWQRDHLLQVVLKQIDLPWQIYDWQPLSVEAQQQQLQTWLHQDRQAGFDVAKAPLMRCTLIALEQQRYRFIWTHHHALLDGWSMPILLEDLLQIYDAHCQGKPYLQPHRRPYQAYVAWLQQQDKQRVASYWQQQLAGFLAPTPLSTHPFLDQISPSRATAPQEYCHRLSKDATAVLQNCLRQQRVSLAVLVYSVWGTLLSRYSGEPEVVFGVTVSGRDVPLAGIEEMVGLFINTLPLRIKLPAACSGEALLKQLQQDLQDLQAHSYIPLIEIQRLSEVAPGHSLFNTLVVIENYAVNAALQLGQTSLPIEKMTVTERTNYPLTLTVVPGEQLSLRFSYNSQLFEPAAITRMAAHVEVLLNAIAADPTQPVATLPMLTASEQQQLIKTWNYTAVAYPNQRCIHHLFEAQVEKTPNAIAIVYQNQHLTYRDLNLRANQFAHALQSLGVKPETLVGLCVERSPEMVIGLLAILKAGGAYVPLDPSYPKARLAHMLRDSQVPILLTQAQVASELPDHQAKPIYIDTDWASQYPTGNPKSDVASENLAYVIYTSGSTGQPKGVQGLHRGTVNRLHWMWTSYPFEPEEMCCQKTALSFVDSVWEIFGGLLQGVPTLIIPDAAVKDPYQLIDTLSLHQVSRIVIVPSLLSAILDSDRDLTGKLKNIKYWVSSGEVLDAALVQRFYAHFGESQLINLYGSSEVSADATCYQIPNPQISYSPDDLSSLQSLSNFSSKTEFIPPQRPEEEVLIEIWKQTFGLEKIGIRDNFFEIGGNWSLAVRVTNLIQYLFDISLPVTVFHRVTDVQGLATEMGRHDTESGRVAAISQLLKQISVAPQAPIKTVGDKAY